MDMTPMFRKITVALVLLLSLSALARTRSVSSGASPDAAALSPATVAGATVSGAVSSVAGNIISLAGGLVTIDASSAKITDDRGNAGSIASITPGSTIFAILSSATANANAALPASVIAVRRIAQVELSGTVTAIGTNSFTVLGRNITVDANTSFGGSAKSLAGLFVNDNVVVSANASGGALLATTVMASTPFPRTTLIHGTVKSIGTDSWLITDSAGKEWTVVVNAQTKIIGDPKVGDPVEILANVDRSNQYVAVSIMKSIVIRPLVNFTGEVKAIGPASWVIRDSKADKEVTVAIDRDTKISGDPKVGDGVNVTASVDAAGNYTAVLILKLGIVPPPQNVIIRGVVKSIVGLACVACDDTVWTIGPPAGLGPDVQVHANSRTKIAGDPRTGDNVVVEAQSSTNGYLALSIVKQ